MSLCSIIAPAAAPGFAADADLHVRLPDRFSIDSAIVIAVSGGGPAAIRFAAGYPGRCRGLILVSASAGWLQVPDQYRPQLGQMFRMAEIPPLRWLIALMGRYAPGGGVPALHPGCRPAPPHPRRSNGGLFIGALQLSTTSRLRWRILGLLKGAAADAASYSLPIEAIAAPTLVMHGAGDRVALFAHAEEVAPAAGQCVYCASKAAITSVCSPIFPRCGWQCRSRCAMGGFAHDRPIGRLGLVPEIGDFPVPILAPFGS